MIYHDRKHINDFLELRDELRKNSKRAVGKFGDEENILWLDFGSGYISVHSC